MQEIIRINSGVARQPAFRMAGPLDLCIRAGEQVAVVGPNGGGKSVLADLITGTKPLLRGEPLYDFGEGRNASVADNVKYIAFNDAYGDGRQPAYYQQRWNQGDDTPWPTVGEILGAAGTGGREADKGLPGRLGIGQLLDKAVIQLSSGELRRFQLARALRTRPRLLVIDNPFIGLDKEARAMLGHGLAELARETTIVILVPRKEDIPDFITHVIHVERMSVSPKLPRDEYFRRQAKATPAGLSGEERNRILSLPDKESPGAETIAAFRNIRIRYGGRTILDGLTWSVGRGEKWALTGENGAGKSTLLSLICADNPQAYACDITLFGRKRGTGESIWDIKRHIGYVSPEMYNAYDKNVPVADIVASGLHDTIGLYRRVAAEERQTGDLWISLFGLRHLADRPYQSLSGGEKRMVLLARAFVKDPEFLVLDEPFHGLDNDNRKRAGDIIEAFCHRPGKTLVMVTHYEEELPACIDHRLHLKKTT